MTVAAYVYPGWHSIPERDASFYPGFTEWDLVEGCRPRFEGHHQPRRPTLGRYDDRDPVEVGRRIDLARAHGVDAFVYGLFWCRGKRVFEDALDLGFLGSHPGRAAPFAVMWANRMPRRVLPVMRPEAEVIDPEREVPTDVADFVRLVDHLADRYFSLPNYLTIDGRPYFSIFDSTFFIRELGLPGARTAIAMAKARMKARGLPELHLAAIDPAADVINEVRGLGFDSVTHYVLLPYWKGPTIQEYGPTAQRRAAEWSGFAEASGLPYHPSVAPGWDASPRGADFGPTRPDKYPWSPVVIGEHPTLFQAALERALRWPSPLTLIASLNEWSEGHYLEPDERFGLGWLEAVQRARATIAAA